MAKEGERTEAPTPKRLEDAREKGDVAQSRDVPTLFILAAVMIALSSSIGEGILGPLSDLAKSYWGGFQPRPGSLGDFHSVWLHLGAAMGLALAPLALVLAVVGTASHLVQTGFMLSGQALKFQVSRLSLAKGFERLVSLDRLFDFGKSLFKIAIVIGVTEAILTPALPWLLSLVGAHPLASAAVAGELSRRVVLIVLGAFALFAAIDVVWVRFRHQHRLRMTKTEVRDEHKQREGDPQVRGRIRQIQRELSRHRMIAAVADASVVVTNPTHFAVALKYEPTDGGAPRVVAKGRNHLALRIRREAEKHGIPIVENPPVAQLLYKQAAVDREIPEDLFQAVAELLAYVYRLDPQRGAAWRAAS